MDERQHKRWISAADFARLFSTTERHVTNLCGANELPHVRLGRLFRIDLDAVLATESLKPPQQEDP